MMRTSRLVNDLARGRIQLALIPVAPILLLPFIIVGFVIGLPLWVISLAVLSIARGVTWVIDKALGAPKLKPPVDYAFQWVLTFGGLARKLERR